MTNGNKIESLLKAAGVAVKDVWCGSYTGIATFYSYDMAMRAARMFQSATIKVRGVVKSVDQTKASEGIKAEYTEVYRVGFAF